MTIPCLSWASFTWNRICFRNPNWSKMQVKKTQISVKKPGRDRGTSHHVQVSNSCCLYWVTNTEQLVQWFNLLCLTFPKEWDEVLLAWGFGLHKKKTHNSYKKLRPEGVYWDLLSVARGAKFPPGTSILGQWTVLGPCRAGWCSVTSVLGPGILQHCCSVQGSCAWNVQHALCSWEHFQALPDKARPRNRLLSAACCQVPLFLEVLGPTSYQEVCRAEGKMANESSPQTPPLEFIWRVLGRSQAKKMTWRLVLLWSCTQPLSSWVDV